MKLKLLVLGVALVALSFSVAAQNTVESGLKDINVHFMVRGYFYAGSRIVDRKAFGGFGTSENYSRRIDASLRISEHGVVLIAFPDQPVPFSSKYRGIRVILANTTEKSVGFAASDSRLYLVQEAVDTDGLWKSVEYTPSSWCGNSYHTVYLPSHEYWEFAAARYTGERRTKFRFKLIIDFPGGKPRTVISNEFDGSVNPKQFLVQQGHKPTSIMDPYNN